MEGQEPALLDLPCDDSWRKSMSKSPPEELSSIFTELGIKHKVLVLSRGSPFDECYDWLDERRGRFCFGSVIRGTLSEDASFIDEVAACRTAAQSFIKTLGHTGVTVSDRLRDEGSYSLEELASLTSETSFSDLLFITRNGVPVEKFVVDFSAWWRISSVYYGRRGRKLCFRRFYSPNSALTYCLSLFAVGIPATNK